MKSLVVDASVVVKWVLLEVHSEVARDVLSVADLSAPDLIWAELGSVVWRRRRLGEFDTLVAREMLGELCSLEIRAHPTLQLASVALDIAIAIDHSLYDCLYLALAEEEDTAVVTADRRFHRAVADSVWADRIVWIEDAS